MHFDNRKLIVGVGSALVDILVQEDDAFIAATGAAKGGMIYVEPAEIERLTALATGGNIIVPGGSACNTAIGVGELGGSARFVGKRGRDSLGKLFETDLLTHGVVPELFESDEPTGRVLSVVTPDAQRTMFTYLGAAAAMSPEEITPECFRDAAIVHVEGYLLFNRALMDAVLKAARAAGAKISLDLASFTVVEESRDLLDLIVAEYIDILIANEDEALAFTGEKDELKALELLARDVEIAVLKIGSRGSLISGGGEVTVIKAMDGGPAKDTTGAGDLWASGFLFGLVNGMNFEKSGSLGSCCGYEVCQLVGAKIAADGWKRIKEIIVL
jgi:sugar/nucleoside kinase (ribokinase family)